jgi:hypothetical protein
MTWRSKKRALLLCLPLALLAGVAGAQGARGQEDIVWTTFVAGPGRAPARGEAGNEPGVIELGSSAWQCGFGRIRHAAISNDDWSVQRVLACQRGEATVSATSSCRVRQGRVEERAATLSLGTTGESAHVTVTLSCRAR